MYVGLRQPRGDGERYVTPARAAAKETSGFYNWNVFSGIKRLGLFPPPSGWDDHSFGYCNTKDHGPLLIIPLISESTKKAGYASMYNYPIHENYFLLKIRYCIIFRK